MSILILTMLVMSIVVLYQKFTQTYVHRAAHRNGTERSMLYAQTSADMMKDTLRNPTTWTSFQNGTPIPAVSTSTSAGYGVTSVTRDPYDASLIDLSTTGYFDLSDGDALDPRDTTNRQKASMTVIDQKIRVRSVGDFFAAVPTTLQIQAGVNLSGAAVYARDLVFLSPQGSSIQTRIGNAYYYNSLQMTPGSVVFGNPPIKLAAEPNLATVDASMRNYYLNWAGGPSGDILPLVATTLGTPSNPYGVYYAPGNLTLGSAGTTLIISQPIVLYVQGAVVIHSNIVTSGNGWLAVVAENDIVLATDIGSPATIQGTFDTGGTFFAQPNVGVLNFVGGFDAQVGANLAAGWPTRFYTYQRPPAGMFLPYFVSVESYNVIKGKFSQ